MPHLSESTHRLQYLFFGDELNYQSSSENNLWFISLPFITKNKDFSELLDSLFDFFNTAKKNTTFILLTNPFFASTLLSDEKNNLMFKLWIGVECDDLPQKEGQLLNKHASLLVLSNNKESFKHAKTRIGYTFCPICNKTTKDYGGKKHLYHEFGTLMSDVWKDLDFSFTGNLSQLIERLKDLFGIDPFYKICHYDLRGHSLKSLKDISHNFSLVKNEINKSLLINGDCIEKLKEIPDNSVDFCFVDPPYNIKKKYETWDDGIDIQEYFDWCDKWLTELARIIKPNRTVAILNIPQWAIRHFKHLNNLLLYQDWIIWDAMSVPVRMIMPSHYSILCFSKGESIKLPGIIREENNQIEKESLNSLNKDYCIRASCIKVRKNQDIKDRQFTNNLWSDIHRLKHNSQRVDHPTQLPPLLMYRLISLFTNENETILDCFNGSGTTSLCSRQLNRKFIGIELSEYYHNIALTRHQEIEQGVDPFRKNKVIPKTKNNNITRVIKQKYLVDKKTLQLEVKELSIRLNKIPTRDDVIKFTKYKIDFFDNYFSNWSEVTAAARTTGMAEVENKSNYMEKINR